MAQRDAFSRWLGIECLEIAPGRAAVRMTVRPEMGNGFGLAHGGIAYSVADSALAFACNTHGRVTVAIENTIGYPAKVEIGDVLTAVAEEEGDTRHLMFFRVLVRNQYGSIVARFTGTVYKTQKPHDALRRAALTMEPG